MDCDCVVIVGNCQISGDYTAIGSSVTSLSEVVNSHYTVTVQSQCSDCSIITVKEQKSNVCMIHLLASILYSMRKKSDKLFYRLFVALSGEQVCQ